MGNCSKTGTLKELHFVNTENAHSVVEEKEKEND